MQQLLLPPHSKRCGDRVAMLMHGTGPHEIKEPEGLQAGSLVAFAFAESTFGARAPRVSPMTPSGG